MTSENFITPPKPSPGTVVAKTDWLGFNTVFYNVRTGAHSANIHDLISPDDLEFHPEGLLNYLEFGYSALGQTPLRNIRFLQPHSSLIFAEGNLTELPNIDPAKAFLSGPETSETDVRIFLQEAVSEWEKSVSGPIVVPTSGGFDSRLLNFLIQDKSRIRAFTYGISDRQNDSREVVYAKELCRRLGVAWESIKLENIHSYFGDWDRLFGVSTHAHGMYHMEFYTRIAEKVPKSSPLLSGIVGDLWAGSVTPTEIGSPRELHLLGHAHGMRADVSQCFLKCRFDLREGFFEENRTRLKDARWRLLFLIRFKMILLRYLLKVPASLGFNPWSPFLEIGPSLGMLMLTPDRRTKRLWQEEWFTENGIFLEGMTLKSNTQNSLDSNSIRKQPPPQLDEDLLGTLFRREYIRWINSQISSPGMAVWIRSALLRTPKIKWILRKWGMTDFQIQAYGAYLTLKPIDNLLRTAEARKAR